MCEVISFNEYRGKKCGLLTAKKLQVNVNKLETSILTANKLSTEALKKEYLNNGESVLKLATYIIEQYAYQQGKQGKVALEEIRRDMRYCEVYPEVNKRFKAHLGMKINGEWLLVEIMTQSSCWKNIEKKWQY